MCEIVYTNRVEIVGNGPLWEAVIKSGDQQFPIRLWSGQPGIVSETEKLQFSNSQRLEITYGTGVIATNGGPGGYRVLHDPTKRGAVVRIVETDADGQTEVYIDLEKRTATIGQGWIQDFK